MALKDPLLGKKLGDYKIESLLGKGGMARVYKGYDENLDRFAAVKVIAGEFTASEEAEYTERFQREARAIARLRHPHIVGIYQFGRTEGLYYMAMVFLDGEDLRFRLRKYIAQNEKMPIQEILKMASEIADALDYAHTQGVIHRDIKPSNLMMTTHGAALTDFGLALSTQEGTMGDTFGSAHYIAPEQAVSSARAVPQSDLYSLGVVLYESFAGKVPFDDPSAMSVALKHLNEPPPPIKQFNPALPDELQDVITKVLNKDPKQRHQTGKELVEALYQAVDAKPIEISRPVSKSFDPEETWEGDVKPVELPDTVEIPAAKPKTPPPKEESSLEAYLASLKQGSHVKRPSIAKNILSDIINQDDYPTEQKTTPPTQSASPTEKKSRIGTEDPTLLPIAPPTEKKKRSPIMWIGLLGIVLLLAGGAFVIFGGGGDNGSSGDGDDTPTQVADENTSEPTQDLTAVAVADFATETAEAPTMTPTEEPTETDTPEPSEAPTEAVTATYTVTSSPTATYTKTATPTETLTPTDEPTVTPTFDETATALATFGPAEIRLEYNESSILLTNISTRNQNVGNLEFVGDNNGQFFAFDWSTVLPEVNGRNVVFSFRSEGCVQLNSVLDARPPNCRFYNTWLERTVTEAHFWLAENDNTEFFVYDNRSGGHRLIAVCNIEDGVCEFAIP